MNKIASLLPFVFSAFFWTNTDVPNRFFAPAEICDNGVDDDNDGLIDLNDKLDCDCPVALPESLIPNPSFEENTCCPQDRSQLYCAESWIQASEATTDYLHTCGWMGWPDLPPPLPFPDGEGCVGFRNGRTGGTGGNGGPNEPFPNWKEYAGACLISPLKAGVAYRFEFWVGFTLAFNSPPTNLAFYGSTDCANLPFGIGDEAFGCPTNGPGWVQLGEIPIKGAFEWKLLEINVTPEQDMYAIAIGPTCDQPHLIANTYYFFDNLVLADAGQFDFKIKAVGNPCGSNFELTLPNRDTLQYQWYRDGVALVGETQPTLADVENLEGNYQVRLLGPNSCRITPVHSLKTPVFHTTIDTLICRDETVFFNQSNLNTAGEYLANLHTSTGCDSIVQLNLQVSAQDVDTVFAKIFESETYHLGNYSYSKAGEYDAVFLSQANCDSLVHLVLDFYKVFIPNALSPNGDGINDLFSIFSGDDVKEVLHLDIYDRWGGRVYRGANLKASESQAGWDGTHKGKDSTPGIYTWKAIIVFADGKERELSGSVMLVR